MNTNSMILDAIRFCSMSMPRMRSGMGRMDDICIQLTVADGQSVNLIVKNKGKGIPPELQALIFERFYRVNSGRKGEGLGIGLAIVKNITLAHYQIKPTR